MDSLLFKCFCLCSLSDPLCVCWQSVWWWLLVLCWFWPWSLQAQQPFIYPLNAILSVFYIPSPHSLPMSRVPSMSIYSFSYGSGLGLHHSVWVVFVFETECHFDQDGPKLTLWSGLTLIFWPSCLHLPRVSMSWVLGLQTWTTMLSFCRPENQA